MTLRKSRYFIKGISIFICITTALALVSPTERYFQIAKNLDIFATLFREVNTHYVDEVDPDVLIKSGIDAMLLSLDPYTNYIPEDEIESFRSTITGQYAGIGAFIGVIDSNIVVTSLYDRFAAHKAGIRIGDELLEINGVKIKGKSISAISSLLRGPAKSIVTIALKRYGHQEKLTYTFAREKIVIDNVSFYGIVSDNVGYIKLEEFTSGAGKEVKMALRQLKSQGAKSIILDLRDNLGGLLGEAVNVSNIFISKNKEVVSTKGKATEWNKTYKTLNSPVDTRIPLAVLINENSASAAEIVSGVIQDYDRGVLLGAKTFGKGLVQATRPLTYNTQLKVTTAKYYIPSGRCIQALDYTNRNQDGSVSKVPDSLKVSFTTKNGREVFDGGGIDPDIKMQNIPLAPVTRDLISKAHIFNYATRYISKTQKLAQANAFTLSDTEYDHFIEWLRKNNYHYITEVEKMLINLDKLIETTNDSETFKPQIEELKKSVLVVKKRDLFFYKNQIKEVLEKEIISHSSLRQGEIEASFDNDQTIARAIEILDNHKEYQSIRGN